LGHVDTIEMEYDVFFIMRQRWRDTRLKYSQSDYEKVLEGESWLADKIWTPNIYIENEVASEIMSTIQDSVQVMISPSGEVTYHYRMRTAVFCDVKLQRFPHDQQNCELKFESWTYTDADLILKWETVSHFDKYEFTMNEYVLVGDVEVSETNTIYDMAIPAPRTGRIGKLTGNYSTLMIRFTLSRHPSQYILDYYVPSSLLVAISWVSFWLEPSAIPGRTTLGTASWLTFINLHKNINDKVSRVQYIKFIDIWFLTSTIFIFTSLIEFALVNSIDRGRYPCSSKFIVWCQNFKKRTPAQQNIKNDKNKDVSHFLSNDIIVIHGQHIKMYGKRKNSRKMNRKEEKSKNSQTIHQKKLNSAMALLIDRQARWMFPLAWIIFMFVYFVFLVEIHKTSSTNGL